MATVVNNPSGTGDNSGMGFLLGIILLIVFVVILLFYGLPLLQNSTSSPQLNVPGKIDVNVNN